MTGLAVVALVSTALAAWALLRPAAATAGDPLQHGPSTRPGDAAGDSRREPRLLARREPARVCRAGRGWGPALGTRPRPPRRDAAAGHARRRQSLVLARRAADRLFRWSEFRPEDRAGDRRPSHHADDAGERRRRWRPAWGPDGWIYFDSPPGLSRIRADGGTPEPVVLLDSAAGELGHAWPAALPNGKGLLLRSRRNLDPTDFDIVAYDLKARDATCCEAAARPQPGPGRRWHA